MKTIWKRALTLTLALTVTAGSLIPAASAVTIPAACDETYYATLDYYGAVQDASVVKSYRLNGNTSITDYGTYDQVVNLTDDRLPTVENGAVTFTLGEDAPEKFYFEGKTQAPFEALPWNIAVSYKLNGAPILAEDLGGKTGLVEILLDVTANPGASEYSRNNLVLTAAAAFNDDDITSLEAPGAEVQMVGNLRAVLFMVLPGEEQHYAIRVGSDDFSFSGLILLAVPATLQQLEQVEDLRQAKEKGEDSLDAISDSMDAILNSMEGMSGSLNAAAGGLDQLNSARSEVSDRKGEVYGKTDLALGDLHALANTLGLLDHYAETSSQAITDLNGALNGLNTAVQALKPELENTRKTISAIQEDTQAITGLLEDVEGYNKRSTDIAESLSNTLDDLEDNADDLELHLRILRGALNGTDGLSTLKTSDMLALLSPEEAAQMKQVLSLRETYENYLDSNKLSEKDLSFKDFIIAAAFKEGCEKQAEAAVRAKMTEAYTAFCQQQIEAGADPAALPTAEAFFASEQGQAIQTQIQQGVQAALPTLEQFLATPTGQAATAQAQAASDAYEEFSDKEALLGVANGKIREINSAITGITKPTADVVEDLADLCEQVGDTGVTDDLSALAALCRDLLKTMKEHEGEGAALLESIDALGDLASRITGNAEELLEKVDGLNATLNTYEPELQSAVADVQTLSGSAQSTLHDLSEALSSVEGLLQSTGPQLDEGTRNTLSGVSASLRKATAGLNQIDTIRSAKDTITDLIDQEWDDHTGAVDGLLNIDANAPTVSMTDPRNPAPGSIQYVMRTQEIKEEEPTEETETQTETPATTFWGRVADMFRGLWEDLKKLFHIG